MSSSGFIMSLCIMKQTVHTVLFNLEKNIVIMFIYTLFEYISHMLNYNSMLTNMLSSKIYDYILLFM